jgi:Flp pilus assembly protein TadD
MAEQERINEAIALVDSGSSAGWHTLAEVEDALRAFPSSSRLWNLRGDLILLDDEVDDHYTLEDALQSYRRAIELDPGFAEAYENIGYYHDVHEDAPEHAEAYFRQAVVLEGRCASYSGLARVLAEMGRHAEALDVLTPGNCPHWESDEIRAIRREIEDRLW